MCIAKVIVTAQNLQRRIQTISSLLLRVEQRSVPPEWQHFFLKRAGRGPQRRLTPARARKLRAFPKFRSVFVLTGTLPSQVQVACPTVTVSHGGPTRHWHSRMPASGAKSLAIDFAIQTFESRFFWNNLQE